MVNWGNSISRCESDDPGLGSGKSNYYRTNYQQCTNWKSDVKECYDNRPEGTVAFQKCGIRSSPGGLSLDDIFNDCSEPTKEFSCENGQNCFAITKRIQSNICDTTRFEKPKENCDLRLNGITSQKCVDWSGDDPTSCNTTLKKPKEGKIIGWKKCTIGEDPKGPFCTPVETEFNCTPGHDCYAIFENNSNSKRCDPTTFETPITNCDGLGNSITVQECTNWKHSDPSSCSNSEKIDQSSIKGWISCKKGHAPTNSIGADSFCNEMTIDNTCKKGLDCYAVTKIDEFAKECDSTTFNGPYTNCEGDDLITYYSCDDWQNSDPNSCFNSNKKPNGILDWSNYYSGSSPDGKVPGKNLKFFNKNGETVDTCEFGKECYPVTNRIVNDTFCVIKNKANYSVLPSFPATKITNGINRNYSLSQRINIGATVFILLLLIISFICLVLYTNITTPNTTISSPDTSLNSESFIEPVNLNLSDYSVYQ